MLSAQDISLVSYRSLDHQATTSGETIASPPRLLSVVLVVLPARFLVVLVSWRNEGSHCGCSSDRSEQRRRFVSFVDMPSVTSQLSMLALHEVGARLDMRACIDCGLPHISSLDAHNTTRIQLLQRHISISSVAAVGTSDHRVHLPHSVAAMSASLVASIGAICDGVFCRPETGTFLYSSRAR